ncbi:MAG: hypothetical protein ACXADY_13170 [Candidatus Hodarchaeales archaeon]
MSKPNSPWFNMNKNQKRKEITKRRINNESFAQISANLLGDAKNKSTIWTWAKRNMESSDIYPRMKRLPQEPYGVFGDVEQWVMFDILSSLFPRLDAMSSHILFEINNILAEQREKFTATAGFLDELEKRIIETITRNTAVLSTRVASAVSIPATTPPPIPEKKAPGGPPPPPPASISALPVQEAGPAGSMAKLRTDFEEMSMEEITILPQEFLEALVPTDRNRLQTRVKELKKIEKMSPEERRAYLQKKIEEKERTEATEGLGGSLTAMLDDSDSLFSRMRRASDDSQVSGTGTFGKFTTDYVYFYCFACGKMNRSEDKNLFGCEHCNAGADQLVMDEEKSNYTYWECLSAKSREFVDFNYSRGKQIVVRSRWKTLIGDPLDLKNCDTENIREITNAALVKTDPDKQFSHYLTLLRMYSQLNLQGDLKTYLGELSDEIQKLPDIVTKEDAIFRVTVISDKVNFLLEWLDTRDIIKAVSASEEIHIQVRNLAQDLRLLQDPDSPQELRKASEVGQIGSKADQILNRFISIFMQLEPELLSASHWKCSECANVFEVKDRFNVPERCGSCGKIITKLVPVG